MRLSVIGILLLPMLLIFGDAFAKENGAGNGDRVDTQFSYVGTYTEQGHKGKGIYCFDFHPESTERIKLKLLGTTTGIKNPSYLTIHPNGKFLYAVSELASDDGMNGGMVWAYKIDTKSGELKALNCQPSEGGGPCYAAVDRTGSCLLVANYTSGSIAALPILEDGSLGTAKSKVQHEGSSVDPERQKGPHAHSVNISPDNNYAIAADLGLDKLLIYKLDPKTASLVKNEPAFSETPPGGGPRHLSFSRDGKFAYISNEMKSSVSVCAFDASKGSLSVIQTVSTLNEKVEGNSTAEILMHPDGKFLYCSNRGHDSLAIFKVEQDTGKLTLLGHAPTLGHTPRNFGIDSSGNYIIVCNQNSSNLVVFKIDRESGLLKVLGDPLPLPSPVCIKFLLVK